MAYTSSIVKRLGVFIFVFSHVKIRFLIGITLGLILSSMVFKTPPKKLVIGRKKISYMIDTIGCKITSFDPFQPDIYSYFGDKRVHCTDRKPITYQAGLTLKLNHHAIIDFPNLSHCQYEEIKRIPKSDWKIYYSDPVTFTQDVEVSCEFLRVQCYDNLGWIIYRNYHAFILPDQNVLKKIKEHNKTKQKNHRRVKDRPTLNVMMIGVDSLARLNHIAKMPKTRKFMLETLSAIELKGYTKIADNTFPNIVVLLTGKFNSEEYARLKIPFNHFLDGFNLLFKSFSQNNYLTMFAEDQPDFGTFAYTSKGFAEKPTDFYLRPLTLALDEDYSVWNNGYCVMNRLETNIILDYVLDMFKKYPDIPKFSFSFNSRLTHDGLNYLTSVDDIYYNKLLRLYEEGITNNTVIIFFADHGFRGGPILQTDFGQIQTRMPLMYLAFPPWFSKKYPKVFSNLITNMGRLTSPFDVHATIMDILDLKSVPRNNGLTINRGISLFDSIPPTRTCDEAGIIPHWCVCEKQNIEIALEDPKIQNAGKFVVDFINSEVLKDYPKCAKLHLYLILKASMYRTFFISDSTVTNHNKFQEGSDTKLFINIIFATTPGGGEFETTVMYKVEDQTYSTTVDSITRVNRYGSDGKCIDYNYYRPMCHCPFLS